MIGFPSKQPKWVAQNVEILNVSDLIPYDRNARIHSDDQINQIKNSIKYYGWTVPILIDEKCNVIAGHGRLYAAEELGMKEVPCMKAVGWSKEKKEAYSIADNKLSENSEWDMGIYFAELKKMVDSGFDLSLVGVDTEEMNLSFNPDTQPSYNYNEVQESDMGNAQNKINNQISSLSGEDEKAVEVICPHCSKSFMFTGV
jgi:ParB family chromosome partitioning protein